MISPLPNSLSSGDCTTVRHVVAATSSDDNIVSVNVVIIKI